MTPIKDVFAHAALTALKRYAMRIPGLSSMLEKALDPLKSALKRAYNAIDTLQATIRQKDREIERLNRALNKATSRLNADSRNSSRPPSTDSPFNAPRGKKPSGDKPASTGAKSHHHGASRKPLPPTERREIDPLICPQCGGHEFSDLKEIFRTQHIELPERLLDVTDVIVRAGRCRHCGKKVKGKIPGELTGTYGPRLMAFVGELHLGLGCSRRFVQRCFRHVFHLPISQGTLQNMLDRISTALKPYYHTLAAACRRVTSNHVDETTWRRFGPGGKALHWLWVLCSPAAVFFQLHAHRSREAFQTLVGDWRGILTSDDYAIYRTWEYGRQTCLAHLLRYAQKFSEDSDRKIALCGRRLKEKLRRLVAMNRNAPTKGEWKSWLRGFSMCVSRYGKMDNEAGRFCRRLAGEKEALTRFLRHANLEPTNNLAERTLRFAVTRRKVNIGSTTDKGERLVERALSLRQTCLVHHRSFYSELVEALTAERDHRPPRKRWIMAAAIRFSYDQFQAGA